MLRMAMKHVTTVFMDVKIEIKQTKQVNHSLYGEDFH